MPIFSRYALVMPIRVMDQVNCGNCERKQPLTQVRTECLLDQMTCLMDHLTDRQEEEANFNFIEEKIARPLIDLGAEITAEQVFFHLINCSDHILESFGQ